MKIIGISGRKQAGKNTAANHMVGSVLLSQGMIKDYYIDENGKLIIKTNDTKGNAGYGVFDVLRRDNEFIEYAEKELWPYVKVYHFADPLKEMCVDLFNLDKKCVYGDNDDKNQLTNFYWKNMPDIGYRHLDYNKQMTHREFLEHFGTKIIRYIHNDAWSNYTLNKIEIEQSELSIIPDVRFPNEVEAIKSRGGVVIRLTRDIFQSEVKSESALDKENYDWSNFDLVINNDNLTINELCKTLDLFKQHWS